MPNKLNSSDSTSWAMVNTAEAAQYLKASAVRRGTCDSRISAMIPCATPTNHDGERWEPSQPKGTA